MVLALWAGTTSPREGIGEEGEPRVSSWAPPGHLQRCQSHKLTLHPSKPCSINRHHKAPEASGDHQKMRNQAPVSGWARRARGHTRPTHAHSTEMHAL